MLPSATTATFRTTTQLLEHQQEAVAKLLPSRVGALFAEMGVGKSRIAIELVRLRRQKIDRVVWFCPVSLKETIRYEILKHTDCRESDVYMFGERTSERTLPADALWYIVGIESMSASARAVFSAHQLISEHTFVIVDESTYIKGHDALRTQRITRLALPARYRLVLTGTPISQGVVDLYAQMRFLDERILGYKSFYSFARNHLEYSDKYPGLIVRSHNVEYLAAKMRPYVYQVTKDEAGLNLPDKFHEVYACRLTPEQEEAYQKAKKVYLEEALTTDWDSLYIFRLFTALQSIICGYWTRPDGESLDLPHQRIELLLSVLGRIPTNEKVIIWAQHHYSVGQIRKALTQSYSGESVTEFHGGIPAHKRKSELARWRQNGRFLLATQAAGGHGLTLIESHHAVFYSNGFKYSERLQAEDRQHRIGQAQRPVYIDLTAGTGIERRIFDALDKKGNALQRFRREVDKVKKSNKDKLRELVKSL